MTAYAVFLVVLHAFLSSDLHADIRLAATFAGLLLGGISAGAATFRRARLSHGRRQRAWALMTVGLFLGALGNLSYLLPLPEWTLVLVDAVFFVAACSGIAALLMFPTARRRGTESARMVLDGVIVGGSILYVISVVVFPVLLTGRDVPFVSVAATMLLPVVQAVMATLAVLLILRGKREDRTILGLVGTGVVCWAIGDLQYAVLTAHGVFGYGSSLDMFWIIGYALIGLAALYPRKPSSRTAESHQEMSALSGTVLMFGLFFGAAVLGITQADSATTGNPLVGAMWIGVLVAVAIRQILLIVDNDKLRLGLERRVRERTAELHKLSEQSELLITSVGDGIYGVDRRGLITFVNPAAEHILGYPADELIGRPAYATFHTRAEDTASTAVEANYITGAIELGVRTSGEEDVYRRSNGREVPVEVTASPLTSAGGILGAVIVFRDVTERREVDRMKTEFISVVSHELRTPLTAIRGSLGLISGGAVGTLPPQAAHMVSIALESSERLTRLINDILDIEKIEAGTSPMDVGDHAVVDLIGAAVAGVQVLAFSAGVRLEVLAADGVVRADHDRVVQALLNLLGNAIKFSPPNTEIEIEAVESGEHVLFRVTDHGRGIPEDKLDRIFDRFEQVDSSDAREKGGTGLGLAISRSIVERHGGRIWAESAADEGATFRFTLPRAPAPSEPDGGPRERAAVVVHGIEEDTVAEICGVLDTNGYRAVGVSSAEAALDMAAQQRPAAVVLAADGSVEDATLLLTELRHETATRDLPVVVVTAQRPEDSPSLAACADGWVHWPGEDAPLVHALVAAILGQRTRGAVMVVEDDDDLADVIRALLERRGLFVHRARTASEAISYCTFSRPNVLILDRVLPDGDAVDIVASLRDQGRLTDVPLVVYSAEDVRPDERDDLRLGETVYLSKGRATPQEVEARVVELLGSTVTAGHSRPSRRWTRRLARETATTRAGTAGDRSSPDTEGSR